jgi:hypothetical protein
MATKTETKESEKPAVTINEIWDHLKYTDQQENKFQFSTCRDRHIVVLGSKKTNYIVGDIIRRDTYDSNYSQSRKDLQNTITYIMMPDDPTCNICITNLIDNLPIEDFVSRIKTKSKGPIPSPMVEIDKYIYRFTTDIHLMILLCKTYDLELMKNMKEWASDRAQILALVFIVPANYNSEEREKFIISIRDNPEFKNNELESLFEKGIFCISDLSSNDFQDKKTAQDYVDEWRSKFLRTCVGSQNDTHYEIKLPDDKKQSKQTFPSCTLS